ncbi:hypothetical protein ACWEOW_08125 [Monashia sp. NPDC004114]
MAELIPVYDELRRRLSGYAAGFHETANLTDANAAGSRKADEPDGLAYALLGAPTQKYPGGQLFAAVKVGRRYVSYYLMSLYLGPAPDGRLSPELTKRRQGKSCFNFTRIDEALFDELEEVTAVGKAEYERLGLLRD